MEISRRDFFKRAAFAAGMVTAPIPVASLFAGKALADQHINFKATDIECNFTHIYNNEVSLVLDIIRHYNRIIFRGFILAGDKKYDFSRFKNLFPFPHLNEDPPFLCYDPKCGDKVNLDLKNCTYKGDFKTHPISFDLNFEIRDPRFSSIESGLRIDELPKWWPDFLIDPTKILCLAHEDYPLIVVKKGKVTFKDKSYDLQGAKGAIAHHWGWLFPNYIFLMCNDFDKPNTLLSLSYAESITALGTDIIGGYLYLYQGEDEDKEKKLICPINSSIQYFWENDLLCIVAKHKRNNEIVRVNIRYKEGKRFLNFFNFPCTTYLRVPCEIETKERPLCGKSAVLDVKGFNFPTYPVPEADPFMP